MDSSNPTDGRSRWHPRSCSIRTWSPSRLRRGTALTTTSHPSLSPTRGGGGEIRYTIAAVPDGYLLTLAERAGEPGEILWAATLGFVEIMLVKLMSPVIRHRRLPRIVLPFGWNEAADGFEPFRAEGRWTGLRRDGVELPVRLVDGDILHPVSQYSHLLGGSLRD